MKTFIIQTKIMHLFGFRAIFLWPFIIIDDKNDVRLMRHELIHAAQAKELSVIVFYFLYLVMFVDNLIKFKNFKKAYYEIAFEKEAYTHETTLKYLEKREKYAFTKYMLK